MKNLKFKLTWFLAAVLFVFTIGSSHVLAYTINGHVECQSPGWVPYGAVVKVYEVDPVPGGSFTMQEVLLTAVAVVDQNGNFTVDTGAPYGSGGYEVGGPDFVFELLQNINGSAETIYAETTAQTHWNIADNSSVNFTITSTLAVCYNPIAGPTVPNNNIFLFTRVGNHETANIDCKGSDSSSQGYHRPRKAPYNSSGSNSDEPFGSTLDLFGWIGQMANIDYYKVQFKSSGGSWTDIDINLPNKWYDMSEPNPLDWNWKSQSMGPFSYDGVDNLYKIPHRERPGVPWSYIDRMIRFNSSVAANGPCRIKVLGFYRTGAAPIPGSPGAALQPATSANWSVDVNYGEIVLQIDNTPPMAGIISLMLNSSPTAPCDIVNFGVGDNLNINFKAFDARGHLKAYSISALYGHNDIVSSPPASSLDNYGKLDTSGNHVYVGRSWTGSMSKTATYSGSTYDAGQMPSCAYQFRLKVSKRTTNGYGYLYDSVVDTWHVTIQR